MFQFSYLEWQQDVNTQLNKVENYATFSLSGNKNARLRGLKMVAGVCQSIISSASMLVCNLQNGARNTSLSTVTMWPIGSTIFRGWIFEFDVVRV